jgi:uncharacterized protein (TIGR02996 family)
MTATKQQHFVHTIIEQADDDGPRLVFADWLEEHGDPERADFIRVQCALARGEAHAEMLRKRERELLAANELRWTAPLHGMVQRARFVRGFAERLTLMTEAFLTHATTLFRLTPVRHVILTEVGNHLPRLADLPDLGRVRTLEFRTFGGKNIGKLVRSPHLGQLTSLILRSGDVDDSGAALLANAPTLAQLTRLDLYACALGPAGIRALVASPHLAGLTDLVLGDWEEIGDAGAEALADQDSRLSRLSRLHVSFAQIGDAGAAALAAAPTLAGLRRLDLGYNYIGVAGARALADSPHLQSLTHLGLRGNAIGGSTRRTLTARPGKRIHF